MGPRVGLKAVVMRKIPAPAGTSTADHPARSPVAESDEHCLHS